jgi:hypothetical protein
MKKENGGVGIPNLRDLNLCLLRSWGKRYPGDRDKIWRMLVDFKYNTKKPNIFTCKDAGVSNFWKGVLWATRVARMGYMWKVGDGTSVRFWEDNWIGSSSLAIQYWELYCLVNEQNKIIAELWDGENLRCTFRRCVDVRIFNMWEEVVSIASALVLNGEEDELIWKFQSSGVYSSQPLYVVINFWGVTLVYVPLVWSLMIPPRMHFFLWLVSKNKLLTRDNLGKRRRVDEQTCLFCSEEETTHHLLFECVVAKQTWNVISDVMGFHIGEDFESIARCWLCNKRFGVVNILSSAVC